MKTAAELERMGELFEEKGDYLKARRLYEKALRIQERTLGNEHSDLAPYLYNLGLVQCALDNNTEANSLLSRLLRIWEKEPDANLVDIHEVKELMAEFIFLEEGAPASPALVVNG